MIERKKISIGVSFVMIIFVCSISYSQAQDTFTSPQESKTKIEYFLERIGTVFIKEYSEIGDVRTIGVHCMAITDIPTKKRYMGIKIMVPEMGYNSNEYVCFIDYDEIESLLKGMNFILAVKSSELALENFEATYKSTGGFYVTVFNSDEGKIEAVINSGCIGDSGFSISIEELREFKDLIVKAKQKLDSIK